MKSLKTLLILVTIGIVAWNSVYFKDLEEVRASRVAKDFDAKKYASAFFTSKLSPALDKAVDLLQLTTLLSKDAAKAFEDHSHALGIGNLRYFLVKGKGVVQSVQDDNVIVVLDNSEHRVLLATEFIFGNAVRDASGLININEFTNTMDFNNVSAEINQIIRETVLPEFKKNVKSGDAVGFVGAIELNREHPELADIEVIPVQLNIIK
jgi:predicted lipoprotein